MILHFTIIIPFSQEKSNGTGDGSVFHIQKIRKTERRTVPCSTVSLDNNMGQSNPDVVAVKDQL